jgi:hypothetical protein
LPRFSAAVLFALLTFALINPGAANAQSFVLRDHEELDFDRPEAWAMAWFAAVTVPTALAGPEPLEPGAIELAVEGGWIPSLSEEQRTVGFLGEKPEDLNRTSAFGRPRLAVGLPGQLTATVAFAPPVDVGGIEPKILSLAIARPLWQGSRARLGARIFGERGTLRGDLSCPADVAASADPDVNPYGCQAPSRDAMSIRLVGLELSAAASLESMPRVTPYVSIAASRLHAEYEVQALRFSFLDRTLLETDGTFWFGALGASVDAGRGVRLGAELFYAPLDVVGRAGKGHESDGLLNARVVLGYRVR